jgi:hypothetical protein
VQDELIAIVVMNECDVVVDGGGGGGGVNVKIGGTQYRAWLAGLAYLSPRARKIEWRLVAKTACGKGSGSGVQGTQNQNAFFFLVVMVGTLLDTDTVQIQMGGWIGG